MSKANRLRAERAAAKAEAEQETEQKRRIKSADFSRKLDRAEAHIDALEDSIQTWLESDAYTIIEDVNTQTGEYVLTAKVSEPPGEEWPLVIGDAIHNLRSALDHIAHVLARDGHQSQHPGAAIPPKHQRRIQFPIVAASNDARLTVEDFYSQVVKGQLRYVPPPAAACIQGLQPYKRSPASPITDPLWILNELDVIDKHRKLHAAAVASPLQGFQIGGGDVHIKNLELNGGPVERERVIVRLTMQALGAAPVHLQRQIARFIALSDGPPGSSGEVVALLRALHSNITDTVIPALRPFL